MVLPTRVPELPVGKLQQFGTKGYQAERNRFDSKSIL